MQFELFCFIVPEHFFLFVLVIFWICDGDEVWSGSEWPYEKEIEYR